MNITSTPGISSAQNTRMVRREARPSGLHNGSRKGSPDPRQRVPCHGQEAQSKGAFPAFEAAFVAFCRLNDGKAILTAKLILVEGCSIRATQGLSTNELRLSNWLLHKFKTRHGIQYHVLHGGAESVDNAQLAVNRMEFNELIGQYLPQGVFNFDESALSYRLPPNKTLATVKRNGSKSEKDRITVAMCCNMTGT